MAWIHIGRDAENTAHTMKGSVGTSMMRPGERSALLTKRRGGDIGHARDILNLKKVGVKITKDEREICQFAVKYPTAVSRRQTMAIYAIWMTYARAGKLHGVRKPREIQHGKVLSAPAWEPPV